MVTTKLPVASDERIDEIASILHIKKRKTLDDVAGQLNVSVTPLQTRQIAFYMRTRPEKPRSLANIARVTGVSREWLRTSTQGDNPSVPTSVGSGRNSCLSEALEAVIVQNLKELEETNCFCPTFDELRLLIGDVAKANDAPFTNDLPSPNYVYKFINRHNLTTRGADTLSFKRAKQANHFTTAHFMLCVREAVKNNLHQEDGSITWDNLIQFDETSISWKPKDARVRSKRGHAKALSVGDKNSLRITGGLFLSASGRTIPPVFIGKTSRTKLDIDKLRNEGHTIPDGALYLQNAKAGMDDTNWEQVLRHLRTCTEGKVVLVLDGHVTRNHYRMLRWCQKNDIHLVIEPPHTSHILQALDVSSNKPYSSFVQKWFSENSNSEVSNESLVLAGSYAWYLVITEEKSKDAFLSVGFNVRVTADDFDKSFLVPEKLDDKHKLDPSLPIIKRMLKQGQIALKRYAPDGVTEYDPQDIIPGFRALVSQSDHASATLMELENDLDKAIQEMKKSHNAAFQKFNSSQKRGEIRLAGENSGITLKGVIDSFQQHGVTQVDGFVRLLCENTVYYSHPKSYRLVAAMNSDSKIKMAENVAKKRENLEIEARAAKRQKVELNERKKMEAAKAEAERTANTAAKKAEKTANTVKKASRKKKVVVVAPELPVVVSRSGRPVRLIPMEGVNLMPLPISTPTPMPLLKSTYEIWMNGRPRYIPNFDGQSAESTTKLLSAQGKSQLARVVPQLTDSELQLYKAAFAKSTDQRTKDWHAQRRKLHVTGSTAAVVFGISKFQTARKFLDEKRSGVPPRKPDKNLERVLQYGIDSEPKAIKDLEQRYNVKVKEEGMIVAELTEEGKVPVQLGISIDGWILSSEDGSLDQGSLVEIKCPLKRTESQNSIPLEYFIQMQTYLGALRYIGVPVKKFYYVEWYGENDFSVWECKYNKDCWLRLKEKFHEFTEAVQWPK